MSSNNTVVRSMHDLGLAAWFGGGLMGAVGLNGATSEAADPRERLRLSSAGWAKWVPWELAAIGAHAIGGAGLILGNRSRLGVQRGATALTVAKAAVTVAAAATTAWSGALNPTVAKRSGQGAAGATEPGAASDPTLRSAQLQLKVLQWATPVLTGAAIVLGAVHGEQQRGVAGLLDSALADEAPKGRRVGRRARRTAGASL